jgi:PAB1-binding protein PBP1
MFGLLSTHQRIYGSSQGATNNPHVMEERVMNNAEDSGVNEEDKYVTYLPLSPA